MKVNVFAALFVLLAAAPFAFAQNPPSANMQVGVDLDFGVEQAPNMIGDVAGATVRTDISLDNPATANGTITAVKLRWAAGGCTNGVKVKFFRRIGDTLTMTAERGPFTTYNGISLFGMTPPVDVQQGDFIGVARLTDCGGAQALNTGMINANGYGYLQYDGDVSGSVDVHAGTRAKFQALGLWGTGYDTETIVSTLPAVGSAKGRFGSSFKTTLQLVNLDSNNSIKGRIVFHPVGVPGSPGDPSIPYFIGGNGIMTIDDLGAAIGTNEFGSVDITSQTQVGFPGTLQVLARVYNDNGAGGTAGFYEDAVAWSDRAIPKGRIVQLGGKAYMVTPSDPHRVRFNIGVRTFSRGASVKAQLYGEDHLLATVTKDYPANYLEQVDGSSFFGVPIGANQLVILTVNDGDAIFYGTATDNVTNDPAAQYGVVGSGLTVPKAP
ncbi:MAG TPA: hypothetical protein VGR95_13570 [Thermoanaerobaculia bacterium]|nr:hypothetical protein [Thermoanaerobaculia bacterium]